MINPSHGIFLNSINAENNTGIEMETIEFERSDIAELHPSSSQVRMHPLRRSSSN